jgi:transposase
MARTKPTPSESIVKEIKRNTRRTCGAEEKIRLVLEGLKGDYSMADLRALLDLNQ